MLNFIFNHRGNARINQLLNQEGGCSIEDMLLEEERMVVVCRGGTMPKLIEFVCERKNLERLIGYAIQMPKNPNNHDQTHKFPFFAADVLSCNAMVMQAICEGGWPEKSDEEEKEKEKVDSENDFAADKAENSMVQSILNKKNDDSGSGNKGAANEDKKVEVEELEMDLDLYKDGDSEEKKKKEITSVGLKENIKNANSKADDDDEVQTGEGEDVTDADEGKKTGEANESTTKLGSVSNEATAEPSEPIKRNDYTLLDMITGFLYQEEDPLPILCGYFQKVMDQLLDKQKNRLLEYLLIEQNGKVFNGLLKHLQHHSLATFLIHLIEVQITPEKKENKWDASDNSDLEGENEAEPELSAEHKHMQQVLKDKSAMVVHALVDQLSSKNQDDLQMTLNAATVLQEFTENETFFQLLTTEEMLGKLVRIAADMDSNVQNQTYALNFLTQVINQFNECEPSFFKAGKGATLAILKRHVADLCYNSLMIMRATHPNDDPAFTNQSGQIKKIGMVRIRAIEQLRTLFLLMSKQGWVKDSDVLSMPLRKKIIETMLFMIRTFHFCSISHQQAIQILNYLREAFDEEDLTTMKRFVRSELEKDTEFHYGSGRTTSRMNMGQICKIAFELRNFTQQALDDEDSGEGSEEEDQPTIEKRSELQHWFTFCRDTVDKIEAKWNRRLDKPPEEVQPEPEQKPEEDFAYHDKDHENTINELLSNFANNKISQRSSVPVKKSQDKDLLADIMAGRDKESKDDFGVGMTAPATADYADNQFWQKPEMYDLDDLLAEAEQDGEGDKA